MENLYDQKRYCIFMLEPWFEKNLILELQCKDTKSFLLKNDLSTKLSEKYFRRKIVWQPDPFRIFT